MKKFTMKNSVSVVSSWSKRSVAIGSMMALAFFAACGDDVTNDSVVKAESYADKADLPTCGEKYDGMFATIPSKGEIYFCTQKNWQPVVNGKSAVTKDSTADQFTCSTVELADKSGFKVVCGGDSLAVVKNGAKGETGDKGDDGTPGNKGKDGESGPKGVDGQDLTLDSGLCVTRYYAYDVLIFECGDSTYVQNIADRSKAKILPWQPYKLGHVLLDVLDNDAVDFYIAAHESGTDAKGNGTLVRWEGDAGLKSPLNYGNYGNEALLKNDALAGKATMVVEAGATPNDTLGIEPFVGLYLEMQNAPFATEMGGLCFTYTSERAMDVIVWAAKDSMARVTLDPATEKTTVDIMASQFIPDGENVSLDDIMKTAWQVYVVLAGGLEAGTYENNFAFYEIGQFGGCGGEFETIAAIKAKIQEAKGEATPDLEDGRIDPTNPEIYKTVKIGNQVWMAENLRIPYDSTSVGGTSMALCPTDPEELAAKGCLYSWAAAMDSAAQLSGKDSTDLGYNVCGNGVNCTAEAPVQGICPNGWHLPSKDEIDTLLSIASYGGKYSALVYAALAGDTADGLNWLGFSIDSTGSTANYTSVTNLERFYLWTSSNASVGASQLWSWTLYFNGTEIIRDYWGKSTGRSVRCIQDAVAE